MSDVIFFFKKKTAYEMRISDWSSDVCSSDLHSGLVRLPDAIAADLPARVAGMVPDKDDDPAGFDPEVAVSAKDLKRMDRFIHFAMVAAHEAVGQAAWRPQDPATDTHDPTAQARTATEIGRAHA